MSEQKFKILMPQYMHYFKCTGSACEDCCCIGWLVPIDSESYKKYTKIKDMELSQIFEKSMTRARSNSSDEFYAKFKLDDNHACPLLNCDRLCSLQLKLGENYLSKTCTTYPRCTSIVDGVIECSATMSCPEAARLALLCTGVMEFDEFEANVNTKTTIQRVLNTNDTANSKKVEKYFWDLRIFTITVLQNRNYLLWQRLVILGIFYQELQELINSKEHDQIAELIAGYMKLIQDGGIEENLQSIPVQNFLQVKLIKEICDFRFSAGVASKRYIESYEDFIRGLKFSDSADIQDMEKIYSAAYKDFYEPFMKDHEYILENYLVNYTFKNLFPFTGEKTLFDAYMMLILHYSLIKTHLIGIAAHHEGLSIELIIKLIQSIAKTVEHDQDYLSSIAELMRKNGFNKMAYMAILLKN